MKDRPTINRRHGRRSSHAVAPGVPAPCPSALTAGSEVAVSALRATEREREREREMRERETKAEQIWHFPLRRLLRAVLRTTALSRLRPNAAMSITAIADEGAFKALSASAGGYVRRESADGVARTSSSPFSFSSPLFVFLFRSLCKRSTRLSHAA